jgi:hypothetical protein
MNRGSARFRAHRPLPSMMMAMWAGTVPEAGISNIKYQIANIKMKMHILHFAL